ncbi:MAG: helix-turn-helix transcriptional regulator [Nitriliruptoraceae bacterium]|nr:helix-turn-helix transcriptional regulator [Nitriliruptoraceae bacterium]
MDTPSTSDRGERGLDPAALASARLELEDGAPPQLGARLRAARQAQRMTLTRLADRTELTKGFLSKVERGLATPSVASLLRVCEVLGLPVGSLWADASGSDHEPVRVGAYPSIGFGGENIAESLLTPSRERRLQVIHSRIQPGGGSGVEAYTLPVEVEVEFVFVLRGTLELHVADAVHVLAAGDALTFLPHSPHAFVNPDPQLPAEVLWILTPALPSDDPTSASPLHG